MNKNAPVFVLRSGQTQANLDIINFVSQHQPCGFLKLSGQLQKGSYKGFKARLSHLVLSDQLQADKTGVSMESWTFALGEKAGKLGRELPTKGQAKARKRGVEAPEHDSQAGPDETREPAPVYVGVTAPPREPEVMTGPTYCPKPMQALRPGSDDLTRCPSLRQGGQRLPFTGGYMSMEGK